MMTIKEMQKAHKKINKICAEMIAVRTGLKNANSYEIVADYAMQYTKLYKKAVKFASAINCSFGDLFPLAEGSIEQFVKWCILNDAEMSEEEEDETEQD